MLSKRIYKIWQHITEITLEDGTVCDIKIVDVNIEVWNEFLSFVRSGQGFEFIYAGEETELPNTVEEAYFSVRDEKQKYTHHFSYNSIVQIVENDNGVDIGGFLSHKHFSVVIKVGHIFEYIPA